MTLQIHCKWRGTNDETIEQRMNAVVDAYLSLPALLPFGSAWYRLGWSKREALSQPVALEDYRDRHAWERITLAAEESYYSLSLWNGAEQERSCNVVAHLHDPPNDPDYLSVEGLDVSFLRTSAITWDRVLQTASNLARDFGATVVVTSDELDRLLEEAGRSADALVGYAAFWGRESTPRDVLAGPNGVGRVVLCATWRDVNSPDLDAVERLAELIAETW